ncbi:HDOD domain-containing protein [Allochromatium palmeri]|uniref:HDOD domain-containing protein n=1 Tax=Allochromatium palmeri TaxID=231048 RepID=UPI0031B62FE2
MWLDSVIAQARLEELPVRSQTRRELAQVLADEATPLGRIALVVMSDPGLALRVLQQANQVEHRHFSREIASLEDAIQMLGTRTLAELERTAPLAETVLDAQRLDHYQRSCGRALLAALLAQDWAELDRDRVPTEIALAALLNNLGELYLLAHGDARINRYLEMMARVQVLPHEAEYVTLSESLEALGYRLALKWSLPEMARESMRGRNARHLRPLCVMLATQIARHAYSGWGRPGQWSDLRLVAELLELDVGMLCDRVDRVLDRFNERAWLYGCKPLDALPLVTGREEARMLARPCDTAFCLAPRADDLARASASLVPGVIDDRERLILAWLRGLHRGLGLNRVLYVAFDPLQGRLTAEQLVGTDFEPSFNRFSLALEAGGLFARLIETPGALWLNAANRAEWIDQVPVDVKTLTGVESFMARSVWVRGQPVGLVYADRRAVDCALDVRAYQGFMQLAALAEAALARFG